MKIEKIIWRSRRDFKAIYVCEHCGTTQEKGGGYDDDNFHRKVIPSFVCPECGKKAPEDYKPLTPKYGAHEII